jgi:hypothetical protein
MPETAEFFAPDPAAAARNAESAPALFMDEGMPTLRAEHADEDFAKVKPGQKYRSPKGDVLTRAYEVADDDDFHALPEGAPYVGPDGKHYTKPTYESIGFTAEMLHAMAQTDEAKEQALRVVYGDKVRRDPSAGLYVDDDGTLRKPGARDLASSAGAFASEVAPAVGMTTGMVAGGGLGLLGGPAAPVTTPVMAAAGTYLGAMGGRQFNNVILTLAGVHLTPAETISSVGWEGAGAAGGEVLGKVASKVPALARGTASAVGGARDRLGGIVENLSGTLEDLGITPQRARGFLGTTPEMAEQAADITARGGKVPPSKLAPEAPMLTKIEEFDAVFRSQNVFAEANRDFYEKEAARILENEVIGVRPDSPLTASTKKVSSREAGQAVLAAAQRDMQTADAALEDATRAYKDAVARPIAEVGGEAEARAIHQQALERLAAAQKRSAEQAEAVVRAGVADLDQDVNQTLALLGHNEDPSALARVTGAQFEAYNAATRLRARRMYDTAREATAGAPPPDVSGLAADAENFLRSMPEAMRARYPAEIADLARLVDRDVEIPGVRSGRPLPQGEHEPPLDWAGLHHLRSWFRYGIDYVDLTPDMKTGALKSFERKINAVLHDPGAPPQLRQAAVLLDQADAFYKQSIPFLNDKMVTSVMRSLESGAGVNPKVVADMLFDPERTGALRRARQIVGENAWRGVEAAHVQNMLAQSRTLVPGQIDFSRFAKQVEEDVRSGLIDAAYSPAMAARLRRLATQMGQFEGSIAVPVESGDTLSMIMRRGAAAKEQMTQIAERDPIRVLSQEMSRLDREHNVAQNRMRASRRQEPLGFLYEQSMSEMSVKAADRILGSQDLILAASNQFDRASQEFRALQKVYVQRFFQRPVGKLGGMRAELAEERRGMTEEVQALMFPGVTRAQMLTLVKDAEFLFGGGGSTDFGGSMAAATRVLNPQSHMPIPIPRGVAGYFGMLPGIASVHRFVLQKTYATIMDAVSHPNFVNWLAGKLNGSEADRLLARSVVQQRLRLGQMVGAGTGQVTAGGARQRQAEPVE